MVLAGADLSNTAGPTIFNALSAASLSANTATINFLLNSSASSHMHDPLGRLPIHFAAANGIRNFEMLAVAHGEDIMVGDRFKKNALHWAAQFGNVKTVRFILNKLPPKDKKSLVNLGDVDGWTPLVWASRVSNPSFAFRSLQWYRSEPADYAATVRCLIENGAEINVQIHTLMGKGEEIETLTPFQLACRSPADEDVLQLLTPTQMTEDHLQDRKRSINDSWTACGICLSVRFFLFCPLLK